MTPNERAEFLAWLNRLDEPTLKEVQQHTNAALTFKRGAKLRYLSPGSQIVYELWQNGEGKQLVGTVVKLHKVSVIVEWADGSRHGVGVDQILGLHIGRGAFAPLGSSQPLPSPVYGGQPVTPNITEFPAGQAPMMPPVPPVFEFDLSEAEQRVAEAVTEPLLCMLCELPASEELGPLEPTKGGPMHPTCARTAYHGND